MQTREIISAAACPKMTRIEELLVDGLRPYHRNWSDMARTLGFGVAKLYRIRKRANIPNLLGRKANP